MADLNELEAAQTIKLAGADASGSETHFVNATANNELKSADVLNVSAGNTTLTITTTASLAQVGGSPLAGRKLLIIQAQTNSIVWGFSAVSQPFTLANGASLYLSVGDGISVYLRRTTGSGPVAVAELA